MQRASLLVGLLTLCTVLTACSRETYETVATAAVAKKVVAIDIQPGPSTSPDRVDDPQAVELFLNFVVKAKPSAKNVAHGAALPCTWTLHFADGSTQSIHIDDTRLEMSGGFLSYTPRRINIQWNGHWATNNMEHIISAYRRQRDARDERAKQEATKRFAVLRELAAKPRPNVTSPYAHLRSFKRKDHYTRFTLCPDDTILVMNYRDCQFEEVDTGKVLHKFTAPVNAHDTYPIVSPDGKFVLFKDVSVSRDKPGVARLVDRNGTLIHTFTGAVGTLASVRFSPDMKYAIAGKGKAVERWSLGDLKSDPVVWTFKLPIQTITLDNTGKYALFTYDFPPHQFVYDLDTGPLAVFTRTYGSMSGDGTRLAHFDRPDVIITSLPDGKELSRTRPPDDSPGQMLLSPDGTKLIVTQSVEQDKERFYAVYSVPDLKMIAAAELQRLPEVHFVTFTFGHIAWLPDSTHLAFALSDGSIRIHHAPTATEVFCEKTGPGPSAGEIEFPISPTGRTFYYRKFYQLPSP